MKSLIQRKVINLPSPSKIRFLWNYGSILGVMLGIQIRTGLLLAMCYFANSLESFFIVDDIVRDYKFGFLIRTLHANGASLYFFFMYIHLGRAIYFRSFKMNRGVWFVGLAIFALSMATAFLGYVLPWGNMSFWAATVITKLFSAIPYIGKDLVTWLLGGFSVDTPTLTRFFYLHVLLPFIIFVLVGFHLVSLHRTGSSEPACLGNNRWAYTAFHPYFSFKDLSGFIVVFVCLSYFLFVTPYMFMDADKFKEASVLLTPRHIQPEWYFLPAYTILRSVPNKLGGVIGLAAFIIVLFFQPLFNLVFKLIKTSNLLPEGVVDYVVFTLHSWIFWIWSGAFLGLLWIGMHGVDGAYLALGRLFSIMYFCLIVILLI